MLRLGDRVEWTSSCVKKEGVIVEVVPAGDRPTKMKLANFDPRDHESYVVDGGKRGVRTTSLYWPRVSLLHKTGMLTAAEIAWCHDHADRIRGLIAAGP